ncbi:diguanylate cyclase [Gilvimarinus sp. F26214L]|uniref:diguanylate cyclase n=1 Tax=Gilvimarinus sp. DZF01 TaxID=3461371 RepID=UPI0040461D2B
MSLSSPNFGHLSQSAGVVGVSHAIQDAPGDRQLVAPVSGNVAQRHLRETRVQQLMSPEVICVAGIASVREAARALQAGHGSCLVVVEQGLPVGVVTSRDMIKILADVLGRHHFREPRIRQFMSSPAICVNGEASLTEAVDLLRRHGFAQLPVVDSVGRVVGMLSREILNEAQLRALEEERKAVERQISNRSRELSEANRELQALALQDSLLKIGNRRALEMDVQTTHLNATRYRHSYALALIDVDYFKPYNDRYGHCAGDQALVTVANCVKDSIRRGDRVYRYGGEEILLLMPETSLHEAMEAVWRLTRNLYQLNVEHRESPYGRLTISAGVSAFTRKSARSKKTWQAVLEEADQYLYQAKALGRNRVYGLTEEAPLPTSNHS